MKPEQARQYIINTLSLRTPQINSLELLANYLETEAGRKVIARMQRVHRGKTELILEETNQYLSSISEAQDFESFERVFPTFTFALATGVGKTRLMGAFVAYLYLVYNIQHFLLVAPNLTIYRKLLDDFSKSSNPKYVFRGIQEINSNTVRIVTPDNYTNPSGTLFGNKIEINIFNIQQFAQKDMAAGRGIAKGTEQLGQKDDGTLASYFDYLKELDDLVVMLDEAHHYHADAALGALDLMDPLLGLEMTATPYVGTQGAGRNARQIKMKNILYSYNLGDAIRGGYVKEPWVGTEADVAHNQFDSESQEADARKLQLAAYFHERAKNAIKEYAQENNKPEVKPVMLVVAKDTTHASELRAFIDSDNYRAGEFKGKVIEVHTKIKGDEADEVIEQLLSLEHPDNIVEIVIHVNMLKEGWDVTNIYTIVPLRQSAAAILTEQTIGRGLRLPYGERTGVELVDRVMVVAHEQYSRFIELAKDSELIQGRVEQITSTQASEVTTLTEVQPVNVQVVNQQIRDDQVILPALRDHATVLVMRSPQIQHVDETVKQKAIDMKTEELVQQLSRETISAQSFAMFHGQDKKRTPILAYDSNSLFSSLNPDVQNAAQVIAKTSSKNFETRNIPIPRLILTPSFGKLIIHPFELDDTILSHFATEATVLEESIQKPTETTLFGERVSERSDMQTTQVSSFGANTNQTPQNLIIAALLDFPYLDYDDEYQKPLLLQLSDQATKHYKKVAKDDNNLRLIVETNIRQIAQEIYNQVLQHVELESDGYEESDIKEPKPLLQQHIISIGLEPPVTLQSQIDTFHREKIYTGFQKACHSLYRFRGSEEARLAYLLDRDEGVEDWLVPAPNQFEGLFWRDEQGEAHHKYEPDFVVETPKEIVIVEVKPEEEIPFSEVQAKKSTAEKYCGIVNQHIGQFGIVKPWKYIIVPTNRITLQASVRRLLRLS